MDCVEEARAASKKDSCPVLKRIAQAHLQSSDEPLFRTLADNGFSLNVPFQNLELDNDGFSYPCFRAKDVLEAMSSAGHFQHVLGVSAAHSDTMLKDFWAKYKLLYPEHDLFNQRVQVDYTHLLPFYVHGDGGRTYKNPLMVLSFYNALGEGTAKNPVQLRAAPGGHGLKRRRTDGVSLEPGVNLLGNTLANRFLFTAMKSEHYKGKPHRFQSLEHFAHSLSELWTQGFNFNGETWRAAILGVWGDAPFLRECGNHTRSFSNISKSATSNAAMKGCCWLCAAGKTGGPVFEDVRVTAAAWAHTCARNNELPWDVPSPLLSFLPTDDSDLAGFYKPDLFHVWHAGVGKDFVGSSLVYLVKKVFPPRKISDSLADLNTALKNWRQTSKEHLHFGKFSFDLLGFKSARTYPVGHWSKSMDTATLTKFVEDLCVRGLSMQNDDEMMHAMLESCSAIAHFMHVLFSSGFYLNESEGWQLIQSGQAVLSG